MEKYNLKMYFPIFQSAVVSLPAADDGELRTNTAAPSSDEVKELIPLYLRTTGPV